MKKSIGFRPPDPPRKWRFDIRNRTGYIVETIDANYHGYKWIAEDGCFQIGILESDRAYTIEDIESRLRRRLEEPGV
jgi:hypothetical protein